MNTARTGFTEAMEMLLEHGADINVQDSRRQQSALMWAISYGHPDAARLLINNGADVNSRTIRLNEEFTPLELEGYGASVVHAVPQGGYTPLIFAAVKGDVETAQLLIEKGADINAVSETDGSSLVIAASQGNEDFALYLLERGADPNATDANGMTSLHYALRTGIKALHGLYTTNKDMVCNFGGEGYLCRPYETLNEEQRAYVAHPDSEVYMVKPKPYDSGKALPGPNMNRLVAALLDRGADPNAKMKYPPAALRLQRTPWFNLENATPFFLAAAGQDLEALSILLEEGAEPLVETDMPQALYTSQTGHPAEDNMVVGDATTLMAAVGMGRRSDLTLDEEDRALEIAKILISLGADVNEHSRSGWTALHAAAFLGSDKLVRFLVEQGADVDVMTGCGRTPISLALADSTEGMLDRTLPRIETAELLLELGAGNKSPVGPLGECIGGRGDWRLTRVRTSWSGMPSSR
jgi:ankyrin repeat protein